MHIQYPCFAAFSEIATMTHPPRLWAVPRFIWDKSNFFEPKLIAESAGKKIVPTLISQLISILIPFTVHLLSQKKKDAASGKYKKTK
jgi:hypothetical protein